MGDAYPPTAIFRPTNPTPDASRLVGANTDDAGHRHRGTEPVRPKSVPMNATVRIPADTRTSICWTEGEQLVGTT